MFCRLRRGVWRVAQPAGDGGAAQVFDGLVEVQVDGVEKMPTEN